MRSAGVKTYGSKNNLTTAESSLVEAMAAAIGSMTSTILLYPLDTAKLRYQATEDNDKQLCNSSSQSRPGPLNLMWLIGKHEGIGSLYNGLGVKLTHALGQSFLYFYAYSFLKGVYERKYSKLGTGANLVIGMLAGVMNVVVTQPLDTLSTQQQTSGSRPSGSCEDLLHTTITATKSIEKKQNDECKKPRGSIQEDFRHVLGKFAEAYKGLGASILLTSNPAIQQTVFEQLKQRILQGTNSTNETTSLSVWGAFLLGAVAKSAATFATYPMVRAKVMIQASNTLEIESKLPSSKSLPSMMNYIVKSSGLSGCYKGLNAQLLKTVLGASLMLAIKEKAFQGALIMYLFIHGSTNSALRSAGYRHAITKPQ